MSREGRGGSELSRSLRMTAPITTDAQFVAACGSSVAAALYVALAQFRRYYDRVEWCKREVIRLRARRGVHPLVPVWLRARREADITRELKVMIDAKERMERAYGVVEEGVRALAKEQGQ